MRCAAIIGSFAMVEEKKKTLVLCLLLTGFLPVGTRTKFELAYVEGYN
jgi:hypothetical protein